MSDKKNIFLFLAKPKALFAIGLAIVCVFLSSNQNFRKSIDSILHSEQKIISKITFIVESREYSAFKLQKIDSIKLEIYENLKNQEPTLVTSFSFTGDRQALLEVKGVPTSLATVDIDSDGVIEIIAPTIDKVGNSRLNAVHFDFNIGQFILVTP